ncbi:MAG: KH domain-containing protein [Patescibacteria group bacterium]|nr:KH domain-containing protein [Patescibacteria group bacterium]
MKIKEYLKKMALFLGIEEDQFDLKVEENSNGFKVKIYIPDDKASLFIGNGGQTLYSIQHMMSIVFRKEYEGVRIVLDVNDYRLRKEEKLVVKAFLAAEKALTTNKEQVLRGLNSYERYLVHTAIAEKEKFEDLMTESYDEGQERCLAIKFK